jgi:hypothetical protein
MVINLDFYFYYIFIINPLLWLFLFSIYYLPIYNALDFTLFSLRLIFTTKINNPLINIVQPSVDKFTIV